MRDRVVALARSLDGLSVAAKPDDYLALVGPAESGEMRASMLKMSGCALVVRGIWRLLGVQHPRLARPYVTQMAVSDLWAIANEAGAYRPGFHRPEIGDVVHVGGGPEFGGPEHVFTVLDITDDPYGSGYLVTGLDGGQRDEQGHQIIRIRDHVLEGGRDRALKANDPGGGYHRIVRGVIDVEKVFERFGSANVDRMSS